MKEKFSLVFFSLGLFISLFVLEGCAKSNITETSISDGSSASEQSQAQNNEVESSSTSESTETSSSTNTTEDSNQQQSEEEEEEEEEVETFTLTGTYLNSNGDPIEGVKICIDLDDQSEPLCTTTGTGENAGKFSFPSEVSEGTHTIYPDPDETYTTPPHNSVHPSQAFGSISTSTDDIGSSGSSTITAPGKGKLNLQLKWEGNIDLDAHLIIKLGADTKSNNCDISDGVTSIDGLAFSTLNMNIFEKDGNCYGRVNWKSPGEAIDLTDGDLEDGASLDLDNTGRPSSDNLPFLDGEEGRLETISIDLNESGELLYDEYIFYITHFNSLAYSGGEANKNLFSSAINTKIKIFGDAPGFETQIILPIDDDSNTYPESDSTDKQVTWYVLKLTKRSNSSAPLGILNINYQAEFADDCRSIIEELDELGSMSKCKTN